MPSPTVVRARAPSEGDGHLEAGEHVPAVAAGGVDQVGDRIVVGSRPPPPQAPPHQLAAARRQSRGSRRNSVDRLISGGFTSKVGFSVVAPISTSKPGLHARQQGVLLGLVEAVDLVEEQDRALDRRCRGAAPLRR